jgi:excisionase family DNA binding protein
MVIPDNIAETGITLKDRYFDLRGLSAYSSLGVGTIRDHIRSGSLPSFKVKGKILIRRSEFDRWLEDNFRVSGQSVNDMVDEILDNLKTSKSEL